MSNWTIETDENYNETKFEVTVESTQQDFDFFEPAVKMRYYTDLTEQEKSDLKDLLKGDDGGLVLVFFLQITCNNSTSPRLRTLDRLETSNNGQSTIWYSWSETPINSALVVYDVNGATTPMLAARKSKGQITKPNGTTGL